MSTKTHTYDPVYVCNPQAMDDIRRHAARRARIWRYGHSMAAAAALTALLLLTLGGS